MTRFATSHWPDVEHLREVIKREAGTVRGAAQNLAVAFAARFESVVLARVFIVLPFRQLPDADRARVNAKATARSEVGPNTQVLSLLGTAGRELAWRDRLLSQGHLAIPLTNRASVQAAPMLARLLGDLDADLAGLDEGRAIASSAMLGGNNRKFLIPDAQTTCNARGEFVISARDFVAKYDVRTVFGMGGAYVDGTLVAAVVFTNEAIDPLVVSRFPSLISSFKMATAALYERGAIY